MRAVATTGQPEGPEADPRFKALRSLLAAEELWVL